MMVGEGWGDGFKWGWDAVRERIGRGSGEKSSKVLGKGSNFYGNRGHLRHSLRWHGVFGSSVANREGG